MKRAICLLMLIPQLGCADLIGNKPPVGGTIGGGDESSSIPQSFPGLTGWFSADYRVCTDAGCTAFVTTDGTNAAGWSDRSGKGNNVTGFVGTGSTYKTAIQGGKPGVLFDGASQALLNGNIILAKPLTIVVCFKHVAGDGSLTGSDNAIGRLRIVSPNMVMDSGSAVSLGAFSDTTGGHVVAGVFNSPNSFGYLDRVKTTTGDTGSNTFTGMDMGASAGVFGNNYIFEEIIYNRALSDGEVSSLVSYLNSKWALGI